MEVDFEQRKYARYPLTVKLDPSTDKLIRQSLSGKERADWVRRVLRDAATSELLSSNATSKGILLE